MYKSDDKSTFTLEKGYYTVTEYCSQLVFTVKNNACLIVKTSKPITIIACDHSKVFVDKNSTATIHLDDNAICVSYSQARIITQNKSFLYSYGSEQVETYTTSTVTARNNTRVIAWHCANVFAFDNSEIHSFAFVRVHLYDKSHLFKYNRPRTITDLRKGKRSYKLNRDTISTIIRIFNDLRLLYKGNKYYIKNNIILIETFACYKNRKIIFPTNEAAQIMGQLLEEQFEYKLTPSKFETKVTYNFKKP